jgi:hypothetical protein
MSSPVYFQSQYNGIYDGKPILTRVIPSFPYAERFCPYCEQELTVMNAIHVDGHEEIFKCIYQCMNDNCGAYDEEGNMSYVRAYYSCEHALHLFEALFLKIHREVKE